MSKSFKIESRHWMLIAALALATYASYQLIQPYIGPIVMAFIISLLYYPLHCRMTNWMPRSPNMSYFCLRSGSFKTS